MRRRQRPLGEAVDEELIASLCGAVRGVVTVEEAVQAGGFGDAVLELLNRRGVRVPVVTRTMPDVFVDHGPQAHFRALYQQDGSGLALAVREALGLSPSVVDEVERLIEEGFGKDRGVQRSTFKVQRLKARPCRPHLRRGASNVER
ncbi:MAG: transketolase C-terminal domain-containing protein [Dehalococcoidia bacterium]